MSKVLEAKETYKNRAQLLSKLKRKTKNENKFRNVASKNDCSSRRPETGRLREKAKPKEITSQKDETSSYTLETFKKLADLSR